MKRYKVNCEDLRFLEEVKAESIKEVEKIILENIDIHEIEEEMKGGLSENEI